MLDISILRTGLAPLFEAATMPRSDQRNAATYWFSAYSKYSMSAMAGVLLPTFTLHQNSFLAAFVEGGDFLVALNIGLASLWTTAVWTGPGYTGISAPLQTFDQVFAAVRPILSVSKDLAEGIRLISQSLHTYTLSVEVTATNLTTGVPLILKVT